MQTDPRAFAVGPDRSIAVRDPSRTARFVPRAVAVAWIASSAIACAGSTLGAAERDVGGDGTTAAAERRFADERVRFVAAREALADGDLTRFTELEATLVDYPLHAWLVYERLRERFRREVPTAADIVTVETFGKASGDTALARRLVRTLQARFAETENWAAYLALADAPLAGSVPCRTLRAREATAPVDAFDADTLALWIDPGARPEDCEAAFEALLGRTTPPASAVWERVYAAMEADRPAAAEAVLGYLSTRDRRPVEGWIGALDNPVRYLAAGALDADTALNRRIIADLVMRWSRDDTAAAMDFWQGARERFSFSEALRHDTDRALAMRAAYRRMPEAEAWLDAFEARAGDLELQEWRIRTSLLAGDWDEVVRRIHRLPPEEQAEDHWAYWEARALAANGRDAEARAIYARLAELQSWHGFLSAERLGLAPMIEDVPIRPPAALTERLAAEPALVRSREYHRVDLAAEGRREWNAWLAGRDEEEAAAAAALAGRWGLDDRAIFSAGQAGRRQALSLRFPTPYADEVATAADANDLEPSWVYGVARRESAWIADIRSSAGAVGLMQLMPATAKEVAAWGGARDWRGDLTDPTTNIAFGARYLRHVLDRFDGHQALATASYNAGPHRVRGWLPTGGAMEADRWIDTIPFTETRRYVRAVLAYAAIYEKRLSGEPYRLLERLPVVPPAPGSARNG